ncbi:peptide ABC transporter ATP-binding protein [Candidatus Bathyarchaeota archaeon]|nr:MAG: peptide ABC transporter ATP-binding protein [Candidatus Bathyarchaeota archaeon]
MSETPLIELKNVTMMFKVGGGVFSKPSFIKAVDNVSLTIYEGEAFSLVGESGCGKSTLGRIMLGLYKPTYGQVLFRGKDIWSMDKKEFLDFRRNAQIIHQDPYDALNPMRTVYDALAPPLIRYKIAKSRLETREKVCELLRMVGLSPPEDFLRRHPSRLSGGQMQRIAIARAVSVRPSFIVADEAVSMLDASLRISVINLLLDLKNKFNMACLFITHDIDMARYFTRTGRAAVMYLGSIVEIGKIEEILRDPLHPYTSILISATPVPDPKIAKSSEPPHLRSFEIPSLINPPSGCKFHTRCPYAKDICEKEVPKLEEVRPGHFVACHFPGQF